MQIKQHALFGVTNVAFQLILTQGLYAIAMRKYARWDRRKLYSTVVGTSAEPFPSLNPSDDSHERSREAGRKCGALGLLNVLARKRYPPCVRSNALALCPVITASKLRGPFNERGGITPRPLYQSVPKRRTGYLQAFLCSRASRYFRYKGRTDTNSCEFIKAVGVP